MSTKVKHRQKKYLQRSFFTRDHIPKRFFTLWAGEVAHGIKVLSSMLDDLSQVGPKDLLGGRREVTLTSCPPTSLHLHPMSSISYTKRNEGRILESHNFHNSEVRQVTVTQSIPPAEITLTKRANQKTSHDVMNMSYL